MSAGWTAVTLNRASGPLALPSRFLGRQPILDGSLRLMGYELLFRSGYGNAFCGDPEVATQTVIDHWLTLVPESEKALAFVNCTRAALLNGVVALLSPRETVLEVLENIVPDQDLIACCQELKEQGFRLALDDFVPDPMRSELLRIADFIKIDFQASNSQIRHEIYDLGRSSKARFIAEKIETEEQMRAAQAEGCSYFQGYFFSRPVILTARALPQNELVYLRLLAALNRSPANLFEIEDLVLADASLCYRVLRLANSVLHGRRDPVNSVRAALLMIGEDSVRRTVTVALAGAIAGQRCPTLVSLALVRARFCELLAPSIGESARELYLLGLLSLLDVLLQAPMESLLEALPLADRMKGALTGESGRLSRALQLICALESCDWVLCENIRVLLGVTESFVAATYLKSVEWAGSMAHI